MKCFLDALVAGTIFWHFAGGLAQAQLVQVRPGFVKAPFVRVHWYPDGSSYVRAPFVKVGSPGYVPPAYIDARVMPSLDELAEMDWRTLRATTRNLSQQLDAQLTALATGEYWKAQLRTAEIRSIAAEGDGPPAASDDAKLNEIRAAFITTRDTPSLRNIASLTSFRMLNAALLELATPPERRLGRQLSVATQNLDRSLGRLDTGDGWKKYFAVPANVIRYRAAETSDEELAGVLGRFDAVRQNEQFRVIAALPAFKTAHQRLAAYRALRTEQAPELLPRAEELPAPAAVRAGGQDL